MKKRQNTITFQPDPDVAEALEIAAAAMGGRGARTTLINDALRKVLGELLRERAEAILLVERNLRGGMKS